MVVDALQDVSCHLAVEVAEMRAILIRVPRCNNIQPRINSTALLLKLNMSWAISIRYIKLRFWLLIPKSTMDCVRNGSISCIMLPKSKPNNSCPIKCLLRGEKRSVSICGRPEKEWLLWFSKCYGGVGESGLQKRSVYIALHWAYIWALFERRSNEMLYIERRIGEK